MNMKTAVTFHGIIPFLIIVCVVCTLASLIIGYEMFGGSSLPTHLKCKHFVECRIDTHLRIILKNSICISLTKDVFCRPGNTW
jgi:hypothetical protein